MHKIFSVAEGQTIDINCNSANKSCLLQVVHIKAIAALTQFCDFYQAFNSSSLEHLGVSLSVGWYLEHFDKLFTLAQFQLYSELTIYNLWLVTF